MDHRFAALMLTFSVACGADTEASPDQWHLDEPAATDLPGHFDDAPGVAVEAPLVGGEEVDEADDDCFERVEQAAIVPIATESAFPTALAHPDGAWIHMEADVPRNGPEVALLGHDDTVRRLAGAQLLIDANESSVLTHRDGVVTMFDVAGSSVDLAWSYAGDWVTQAWGATTSTSQLGPRLATWQSNGELMLAIDGQVQAIGSGTTPFVGDDSVVWRSGGNTPAIMLWRDGKVSPVSENVYYGSAPVLAQDAILWIDADRAVRRSQNDDEEVVHAGPCAYADASTQRAVFACGGSEALPEPWNPPTGPWELVLVEHGVVETVHRTDAFIAAPRVSADRIVWFELPGPYEDIAVGTLFAMTPGRSAPSEIGEIVMPCVQCAMPPSWLPHIDVAQNTVVWSPAQTEEGRVGVGLARLAAEACSNGTSIN